VENSFYLLADIFGIKTLISSLAVCAVLRLVKKKKPNLSYKAELGIRLLISFAVGIIYLIFTQGDFSFIFTDTAEICGVSLILCGIVSGSGKNAENKLLLSKFLPNLSEKQLDEIIALEDKEQIKDAIINKNESISSEQIEILSLIISGSIQDNSVSINE